MGHYMDGISDEPLITHVAIRFGGKIWAMQAPARHHHIIRWIAEKTGVDHVDAHGDDQGFLGAGHLYLTRAEALRAAVANDQLKNGKIIGGVLTSEDLW